ncbi:hypothetical protein EPO15_16550 [bacterium]|nr:MAG: hypothetical protein EPO15_16550 [bacterium]
MGEGPRFEFPADPAKGRYGPVAHGFKSLIDGFSRATGLSPSQVVAGMVVAAGLSLALVAAAVIVIARDTGPAKPEPVTDYVPGGPPPPDHAALNPDGLGPSPAPTNILGESGPAYAAEESGGPPSGASFDGSQGAKAMPLSSFLNFGRRPPQTPSQTAASQDSEAGAAGGDRPWFKPKAWLLQKRDGPQAEQWFKGTNKSQQSSSAQGGGDTASQLPGNGAGIAPESMTKRRFATSAAERAGRYANQLPSVPAIGEGVAVGAQNDDPPGAPPEVPKNKKGPVEGPVKQEKIPDVGPGKVVSAVQSGPGPSGQARIGAAAPAGDILSVPIDVNRIQIEANKAHDVDRSPGVNTIGN